MPTATAPARRIKVEAHESYPAARGVNEDAVAGANPPHLLEHHPRGEPVHRYRRPGHGIQRIGPPDSLRVLDNDVTRVPAEANQREHGVADRKPLGAQTDRVDGPRHLVSDHRRQRRRIPVDAHPGHEIREVYARRLDPDPDLAQARLRVGGLSNLEDRRFTGVRNPDLLHAEVLFFGRCLSSALRRASSRARFLVAAHPQIGQVVRS